MKLKAELKESENELKRLKKDARAVAAAGAAAAAAPDASSVEASRLFARPAPQASTPYLQSGRLAMPTGAPGLSKSMCTKLAQILRELGIPYRPTPSALVCDTYDALRRETLALLTLRKQVTRREQEVAQLTGVPPASGAAPEYLQPGSDELAVAARADAAAEAAFIEEPKRKVGKRKATDGAGGRAARRR